MKNILPQRNKYIYKLFLSTLVLAEDAIKAALADYKKKQAPAE